MIKILYIVPNLCMVSGVTQVIVNYYRKINKSKFKIDFLVLKKSHDSIEHELILSGSEIFYLKNKICFNNISGIKKVKNEIYDFYKNHHYKIIELHAPTFSFLFMKEAKRAEIPIRIVHAHSTIRSTKKLKNIVSYILNINMKRYANVFFSCSEKSGNYWYGTKTCSSEKYHIITNGIDVSKYKFDKLLRESLRKEFDITNNFVVGFVGRMSYDKNLFFLVDVMNGVIKNNSNYKLIVVGDGKISNEVKDYAKVLGDSVQFLGARNDVNEILNCFDLLLLPSKREGLPMVAVEAQVTGIPCFLSDTITTEVDLGNVEFLPLNERIWVSKILNFSKKNKKINKQKFDIVKCTSNLEDIYVKYYEEIGEK